MDQAERLRSIIKDQNPSELLTTRLITVTSGKGGVGKSNVAVNLAIQFEKLGYHVIVFDADFGLANVEVMFGAIPKYNLSDLIFHGKQMNEILVEGPLGIQFISGGSGITALSNLSREDVHFLTNKLIQLENLADIIIVDTGAGISDTVLEFVKASREVLLVSTPEPTSITDSYALLKTLRLSPNYKKEKQKIHIIANKVNSHEEGNMLFSKLSVVSEKFLSIPLEYLGGIPNDANVTKSVMQQKPVSLAYTDSKATKAFERLAKRMLNQPVEDEVVEKSGISQIFINIFQMKTKKQ